MFFGKMFTNQMGIFVEFFSEHGTSKLILFDIFKCHLDFLSAFSLFLMRELKSNTNDRIHEIWRINIKKMSEMSDIFCQFRLIPLFQIKLPFKMQKKLNMASQALAVENHFELKVLFFHTVYFSRY